MVRNQLFLICLGLFTGQAFAENGSELIQSMSKSMREKNYSGTFVYRHKDKVETLKIIHRNTEKGVNERLITLSGKAREIIRDELVVTCIWPDSKLVLVDRTHTSGDSRFPGIVPKDLNRLPEYYSLLLQTETERVAGRSSHVVDVKPKDQYRYGYRLWIDQDSHLLMRSDLLNEKGRAIEQVLFTELQVHDKLPDEAFEPKLLEEGYQWREIGKTSSVGEEQIKRWQAASLPPGFTLQIHKQRLKGAKAESVEHMIFSDGMASVSVFVEPQHDNDNSAPDRSNVHRGALNIYGKKLNGYRIVVLGEVPNSTVKLIADSIELKKLQ